MTTTGGNRSWANLPRMIFFVSAKHHLELLPPRTHAPPNPWSHYLLEPASASVRGWFLLVPRRKCVGWNVGPDHVGGATKKLGGLSKNVSKKKVCSNQSCCRNKTGYLQFWAAQSLWFTKKLHGNQFTFDVKLFPAPNQGHVQSGSLLCPHHTKLMRTQDQRYIGT